MKFLSTLLLVAMILLLAYSCQTSSTNTTNNDERKTLSFQFIDSSIKPGDDFYMYANGEWYDTATILHYTVRRFKKLLCTHKCQLIRGSS